MVVPSILTCTAIDNFIGCLLFWNIVLFCYYNTCSLFNHKWLSSHMTTCGLCSQVVMANNTPRGAFDVAVIMVYYDDEYSAFTVSPGSRCSNFFTSCLYNYRSGMLAAPSEHRCRNCVGDVGHSPTNFRLCGAVHQK